MVRGGKFGERYIGLKMYSQCDPWRAKIDIRSSMGKPEGGNMREGT